MFATNTNFQDQEHIDLNSDFFGDANHSDKWKIETDGDDFLLQVASSATEAFNKDYTDNAQFQQYSHNHNQNYNHNNNHNNNHNHKAKQILQDDQYEKYKIAELGKQLSQMNGIEWWENFVLPFVQDSIRETFFKDWAFMIDNAKSILDRSVDGENGYLTTLHELKKCVEGKKPVFVQWSENDQLKLDTLHSHIHWLKKQTNEKLLTDLTKSKSSHQLVIKHMNNRFNDLTGLSGVKNLMRVAMQQSQEILKHHNSQTDVQFFEECIVFVNQLKSIANDVLQLAKNEIMEWEIAVNQTTRLIESNKGPDIEAPLNQIKTSLCKWLAKIESWIYLQSKSAWEMWMTMIRSTFLVSVISETTIDLIKGSSPLMQLPKTNYEPLIAQLSNSEIKKVLLLLANNIDTVEQTIVNPQNDVSGNGSAKIQVMNEAMRQYKNELIELAQQNQKIFNIENNWRCSRLVDIQYRDEFFIKKLLVIQNETLNRFKNLFSLLLKSRANQICEFNKRKHKEREEFERTNSLLKDREREICSQITDLQIERNCVEVIRCRDHIANVAPIIEKYDVFGTIFHWICNFEF